MAQLQGEAPLRSEHDIVFNQVAWRDTAIAIDGHDLANAFAPKTHYDGQIKIADLLAGSQELLFVFQDALAQIQPAPEDFDAQFLFPFGISGLMKVVPEFLDFADLVAASGEEV